MTEALTTVTLAALLLSTISCGGQRPTGPTSQALTEFVDALRGRGVSVTVAEEISPSKNGYFSVPARVLKVNSGQINVFVYSSPERASAQAREITHDAQPSDKIHVGWISTARFYHKDSLIVLYLGCTQQILDALHAILGAPIGTGNAPCGPFADASATGDTPWFI